MLALIGAAAAAASVQSAEPPGCDATLCHARALAPFFERLRERAPVHIVQIGDSHTAGDAITGAWRDRLQARYGHGGRGMLAAGRPYPGYRTRGVTAWQSAGWRVNAIFGGDYRSLGPPLGLAGFTQSSQFGREALGVTADTPDQAFDRIIVCAFAQLGGGTLVLHMGAAQQSWPLDDAPACRTIDSDARVPSAFVTSEGAVSITSFAAFRRDGGIALSNLGVSGAQLAHFGRTDDDVVRAELAAYRPDLIVLAFGTNEGFSPTLDPDAYEAVLRAQIARLRTLAGPQVPILLLGPPDAGAAPPMLAAVRAVQRRVAGEAGIAFWDWSRAMGGRGAAARWRAAGLMRGDQVHFTREGGERIGAMLDADLARAADTGD
jgi:lysophospholipase L1-like esterase